MLFHQGCAMTGDFDDFFLRGTEYLLALCKTCGVVQVHHCAFDALQSFEGFFDDVVSGLSQNLNGYIVWNQIFID